MSLNNEISEEVEIEFSMYAKLYVVNHVQGCCNGGMNFTHMWFTSLVVIAYKVRNRRALCTWQVYNEL